MFWVRYRIIQRQTCMMRQAALVSVRRKPSSYIADPRTLVATPCYHAAAASGEHAWGSSGREAGINEEIYCNEIVSRKTL